MVTDVVVICWQRAKDMLLDLLAEKDLQVYIKL